MSSFPAEVREHVWDAAGQPGEALGSGFAAVVADLDGEGAGDDVDALVLVGVDVSSGLEQGWLHPVQRAG
jgi:hypothetical protein